MTQAWDFVYPEMLWQRYANFSETKVEDIDWGNANCDTRIRWALRNDNITTVAELITCSVPELLRIPNFGRKSLNAIQKVLNEHGLALGTSRRYDTGPEEIAA